jgi:hypothetical protein
LPTSTCRLETLLAIEVQVTTSTPPSTSVANQTKSVGGRHRQSKERDSRRHVTTRRSIDWKLVYYVSKRLHERFDFTLEGCADNVDLNSHGDPPHFLPSDSVMENVLSGERVFFNPPWELPK